MQPDLSAVVKGVRALVHSSSLHWLPVRERIIFKISTIVYRCLQGFAPHYLERLLVKHAPTLMDCGNVQVIPLNWSSHEPAKYDMVNEPSQLLPTGFGMPFLAVSRPLQTKSNLDQDSRHTFVRLSIPSDVNLCQLLRLNIPRHLIFIGKCAMYILLFVNFFMQTTFVTFEFGMEGTIFRLNMLSRLLLCVPESSSKRCLNRKN